jgi:hypothetical protein
MRSEWRLVARAISRAACDTPLYRIDRPAEVDDAEHEHHEDGQDEGELDGRLAASPASGSAHQFVTGTD